MHDVACEFACAVRMRVAMGANVLKTIEQHKRNTAKGKISMDGHKWTKLERIAFG